MAHVVTDKDVAEFKRMQRWMRGCTASGPGVSSTNDPQRGLRVYVGSKKQSSAITKSGLSLQLLLVKSIDNDFLIANRMDEDGEPTGGDLYIAKPWELRHTIDYLTDVTGITSTSAQEVEATDGSDTEDWEVRPRYIAGTTIIVAAAVGDTGVTYTPDGGEETTITLLDLNVAGRVWAEKE